MSRALSTIAAGWLLVTYYGGNIAWYETKEDCKLAAQDIAPLGFTPACVPDRFTVEEMRRPSQSQETKP